MRPALVVDGLRVEGPAGPIVHRIDFTVRSDETVALVGESGSGKSMTAKAIIGLLPKGVSATGQLGLADLDIDLSDGPKALDGLRGRHISLLLQNPFTSLSPVHRCGQQVAAALPRDQRTDDEIARRLDEVDLPARVAKLYPFELSGGMRQRVALAASLASDPEVLIGDEPTTALDVTIQAQILDLLLRLQEENGMALILITHDMGVVAETAKRVAVLYAGQKVEENAVRPLFADPHHPYTAALLASLPERALGRRLPSIGGVVPGFYDRPAGCLFSPRCTYATELCRRDPAPRQQPDLGSALCRYPLRAGVPDGHPRAATADVAP